MLSALCCTLGCWRWVWLQRPEEAQQQMGRAHRNNQALLPSFTLPVQEDATVEARFAAAINRKAQMMGALSQVRGSRRSCGSARLCNSAGG